MKGLKVEEIDRGHGGPGGHMHVITTVCVERKAHVKHTFFSNGDDRDKLDEWGSPTPCNCELNTVDLPEEVAEKVQAFMASTAKPPASPDTKVI